MLNEQQFRLYHGTTNEFKPGDTIKPAADTGRTSVTGTQLTGAFASPHVHTSAAFAVGGGRVYEVAPLNRKDVEHRDYGGSTESVSKSGYKVLKEVKPKGGLWGKDFGESDRSYKKRMFETQREHENG